jgi:cytochrome c oxidase subunit 3
MFIQALIERTYSYRVTLSIIPITISTAVGCLLGSFLLLFNRLSYLGLVTTLLSLIALLLSSCCWLSFTSVEACCLFTLQLRRGLTWALKYFVASEVMFFFCFFWSIFYFSVSFNHVLGCYWPPVGIHAIYYGGVPLLNTCILLLSGFTVTWAHKAYSNHTSFFKSFCAVAITLSLAVSFTVLQLIEFLSVCYSMSDSIYGSLFYISTGFHGLHVSLGSLLILYSYMLSLKRYYSQDYYFSFLFAILYWHFVDVIWLVLFLSVYFW